MNAGSPASAPGKSHPSLMIAYHCGDRSFTYLSDMKLLPACFDSRPLWQILSDCVYLAMTRIVIT